MAEGKIINSGLTSQAEIIEGIVKSANAIKTTMGPSGKCVAINQMTGPEITRDGATVAKSISFKDQSKNIGAQLVRKAASLTEDQAGDGTSTTSVLIKEFCEKGQKALKIGANVNEIKSGMLKAGEWMSKFISKSAIAIDGDLEKIRRVATISANNDPEVGNLVVECMEKVGVDGVITADLASGLETTIDVTTGMKLERGWASPQYVTSAEDGTCIMENPYILIAGERLSSMNQLMNPIESLMKEGAGRPLLIVCDDIDDVVSTTLIVNVLRGAIRCCVVKGIDFGDGRKNIMQDIAIATGGNYLCSENGNSVAEATVNDFGVAKKVVVSRDNTIIFEGAGNPENIVKRAEILKKRIADPTSTTYDISKFEKRVANLCGGIAIIRAGGATEAEKLNRKATIEDAILASKSAIAEGCVPGGGYVYFKGAQEAMKDSTFWKGLVGNEKDGAEIVFSSLPVILKTISENSGVSGDVVVAEISKSKKENYGYNAKTKKFCELLNEGILDSAKVIRVALENSISTSSMVLLIDCTILFDESDEEKSSI